MDATELYDTLKTHLDGHDAILREIGVYNKGIEVKRRDEVNAFMITPKPDDIFIQRQNGTREPGFPTGFWVRAGAIDRVEVINPLADGGKIVRLYGGDKVRTFEVVT